MKRFESWQRSGAPLLRQMVVDDPTDDAATCGCGSGARAPLPALAADRTSDARCALRPTRCPMAIRAQGAATSLRILASVVLALGLAASAAAQAPPLVLTQRLTSVFGNFLVGAGPVLDSGSFSEFLTAPLSSAYNRTAADAGAVNGMLNGQPVVGFAGFSSEALYAVIPTGITAGGGAMVQGGAEYAYMSFGTNASSTVRLDFTVPVPTAFVLSGTVFAAIGPGVNGVGASADAGVSLTGVGFWDTASHQGAFVSSGMLVPGNGYRLTGRASARVNGDASYTLALVLSPVPAPAAWLLLTLGLPIVLLRGRRAARAGADGARRRP